MAITNGTKYVTVRRLNRFKEKLDTEISDSLSDYAQKSELATVATSGSYSDLNDAPVPFSPSGTNHTPGLVPDPGATGGNAKYLREDATWVAQATSADVAALEGPDGSPLDGYESLTVILTSTSSVQGKEIKIYYEDAVTPSQTRQTNENGMAFFTIPYGTHYRIAFSQIEGCEQMEDREYTAMLVWRGVEVEYLQRYEQVIVTVKKNKDGTVTNLEAYTVTVAVTGGETITLTTNSSGVATMNILYGSTYTVTVNDMDDYYVKGREKSRTFVAGNPTRPVDYELKYFNVGLFYVLSDGTQVSYEDFSDGLDDETYTENDARYILIATPGLIEAGGSFAFEIDAMANRSYPSKAWGGYNVLITTIPTNGNSAGSQYYLDGLGACRAVKTFAEGRSESLQTYLPSEVLDETYEIAGQLHPKFLGSIGQWNVLWLNRFSVDDMLRLARPSGSYILSTYTTNKWTSTQYSAGSAWYWYTSAYNNFKGNSYAVVPFFAF